MNIHEICSDSKASYKHITVTLDYDEVRTLLNLLLRNNKSVEESSLPAIDNKHSRKLHRDMFVAFELMKNGILDSWGCQRAAELQTRLEELTSETKKEDNT